MKSSISIARVPRAVASSICSSNRSSSEASTRFFKLRPRLYVECEMSVKWYRRKRIKTRGRKAAGEGLERDSFRNVMSALQRPHATFLGLPLRRAHSWCPQIVHNRCLTGPVVPSIAASLLSLQLTSSSASTASEASISVSSKLI